LLLDSSVNQTELLSGAVVQVRGFAEWRRVLVWQQTRQVRQVERLHQEVSRRLSANVRRPRCKYRHASFCAWYAFRCMVVYV